MEFIRPFGRIGKGDAHIAGGKGASLGEMTQAGIPVPEGYVILADSFERFLAETDLNIQINAILDTVTTDEVHTVEHASEKIQALILAALMPADIADDVKKHFAELGAEFVAVRSSATAEDSAAAAWAGQLDTFLNTTEASLLENVQRCWASLFTPRAIFYRFEKGLHSTKISVAVVVQKMVNSDASGIAFSVHPVTEDYNQLIIEAGFGLGEAVVSGQVTPDSYVVTKEPREILDKNISEQSRGLYRKEGGGNEWRTIPADAAGKQVLTDEQILALAETAIGIEKHYGFPVDIEWAMEAGKMYVTQSRPITTLAPPHSEASGPQFVSPELRGFNPADYQYDGLWKNELFATCFWQDCWVPDVVTDTKLDMQGVGVMNLKGGHFLINKAARAKVDAQIKKHIDTYDEAFFKNLVDVSDRLFAWSLEKGAAIGSKTPTLENFRDFVATAKRINFLWLIGASYIQLPVEERLQDAIIEDKIPAEHALEVVPPVDTPLIRYQAGLEALSKEIDGKAFAEIKNDAQLYGRLEAHANAYPWIEIFNFIGERLTVERLYEQLTHFEGKTAHEYIPDASLSPKLNFVAVCMRDVGYVKQAGAEYFSIFSEKAIPFLNKVADVIGLTYREMMLLLVEEVDQGLEGTLSSEELKKRAAHRLVSDDWVVIGGADGKMLFVDDPSDIALLVEKMVPRMDKGTHELIGQVGNRGSYTGTARIIMNTYDFNKLQAGDVLITTMTTPDFIVLMQKSGAIVTDIGGLLCHAAIVSREMNKPCVIGTKFATQLFKDGDTVEVDANNGIVKII
jgi:phosphoenolpyruvate synthase/pyruvate phosphate dikinase